MCPLSALLPAVISATYQQSHPGTGVALLWGITSNLSEPAMTALILSALALADASHDFSTEQPVIIDESTFVVEQTDYVIINNDYVIINHDYVIINNDYVIINNDYAESDDEYVIINHDYVIINHDYQVVEYDETGSAVGTWLLSSAPTSLAEIDGVLWVGMEDGTEQAL